MTEYRVKWEIDIEADTPVQAARLAREKQQMARMGYWTGVFSVAPRWMPFEAEQIIDLDELDGIDQSGEDVAAQKFRVASLIRDLIKTNVAVGVLTQVDVLACLANDCDLVATTDQISAARATGKLDDELELADMPLTSEAEDGFWIQTWLWVEDSKKMFINYYYCAVCNESWQDEADCTCNDRCPTCRCEIKPHASVDA